MPRKCPDGEPTWDAVAIALGIDNRTLSFKRKIPGAPQGKDVDEWRSYLDEQESNDDDLPKSLKVKKLKEEIRWRKLKNDSIDGRLQQDAKQEAMAIVQAEAKKLRSVLVGLVPAQIGRDCAGKTGAEIEPIVRKAIEAAMEGVCK